MSTPAIIILAMMALALLRAAYLHGKKMEGTYHFGWLAAGQAIHLSLLYWGGFFN